MAVEIPVYVDIQGAFDRAAAAIPKEIPKLNEALNKNVLSVKVNVTGMGKTSIRDILTDSTMSAEQLRSALDSVRYAYDQAMKKGEKNKKTSATVNKLAQAYGLVEQRIKGVYNANTVAAMRLEDSITKVNYRITQLKTKLETLTPGTSKFNKINYDLELQKKRLVELTQQYSLYKAGIDASNTSLLRQGSLVRQLTGYFSGLYAAHMVLRFIKSIRDVTGELEYQRVALGHILNDMRYGNELFDQIVEAAQQSPFRITHLVTNTKQLAAYRVEQEKLFDTTMRLADISAGLGVSMDRLILAYGQVRAASVLRGQELRQFTEAGIPLVEELSELLTKMNGKLVTTGDIFKLISERAIKFEYIEEIFNKMTDAGGMFYKMQEEQAKTLKGRWEKLKDAYDKALMSLGDSDTFQNWNDTVLDILNKFAKNLTQIVRIINAAAVGWVTYRIAMSNVTRATLASIAANWKATASLTKVFGLAGALSMRLKYLTLAWKRFVVAVSSNWVGLALTAFATLFTYFTTFNKKTNETVGELSDLEKWIEEMKEANKNFEFGKELISDYEELAKKTELSATENKRMADTLDELKLLYPELTEKIDEQNQSIENRIDIMKEAAKASHDAAVEEAKQRLAVKQAELRGLQEEGRAAELEMKRKRKTLEEKQTREKMENGYVSRPTLQKDMTKITDAAAKSAAEATAKYDEFQQKIAELKKQIETLEELIDPKKKERDWFEWQKKVWNIQAEMMGPLDSPLFDKDEIGKFEKVYDLSKKLKTEMDELTASIAGMKAMYNDMTDKTSDEATSTLNDIQRLENKLAIAQAIKDAFHFTFKENNKSGYTQDPFIKQVEERIKFMKDFQKGYADLTKVMSKSTALGMEAENMLSRGLALGIDPKEQLRAAEDLSQWYEDTINSTFDFLKKNKGVTGTLQDFLSAQIKGSTNNDKMKRDFQSLLQSLYDAKTDFDTSQLKKNIEDSIKKVTEELKRSETVRNFYKNILDMTGDEDLATTMTVSIYGGIGEDFRDRIQKQLDTAFESLDWTTMSDEMWGTLAVAVNNQDFGTILENIDQFPEEWQKVLRQMASDTEKYNADWVKDMLKTYQKTKTFEERISDIHKIEAQRRKEIDESTVLTPVQKEALKKASVEKEGQDVASIQVEALKDTYEWTKAFEDLDRVGNGTLDSLRKKLEDIIEMQKDFLTPEQLKTLTDALKSVRETQEQRNPVGSVVSGAKRASMILPALLSKQGSETYTEAIKKIKEFNKTAKETEKIDISHLEDEFFDANKTLEDGIKCVADYLNAWKNVVDTIADAFNLEDIPVLGETLEGVSDALQFVATILPVIITLNSILNGVLMMNPFIAIGAAIVATIGAIVGLIKGLVNAKVEKLNKKIEEQTKLLDELEYKYGRLEDAMDKAFGSEYIYDYTKLLENLAAQQAAYEKQAALEREKGKKADEDKVKEYEDAVRDVQDKISDMRTQLSEFFTDTDIYSAAEDFAESWIDAYKEFGSVTDAMSEKFNDMIENMINKSLAAKIMQELLQPIFNQIDTMASDGLLSTKEIADIAALAQNQIPLINQAMTNLMTSLSSAGYDVRTNTAGLKGISRDLASASEESILGLAAAINTQNFYISYVPRISEDVSAILSAMTGAPNPSGPTATDENGEVIPSVQQMVYDHLPNIDMNMSEMLRLFKSVITSKTSNTNTNYVAIK